MDSTFNHKSVEQKMYQLWEDGKYFAPRKNPKKKPFTIVLPPPNASGKMHIGNVLMIAIEDLMIRYHRMKGDPTLWIPGTDHAGFETQITFEKQLAKEGTSRFAFDRETLYQKIWDFVQNNKSQIESQIRQMGASVDWDRYSFTLDPHVLSTVYATFAKMHKEGLVYRDNYMVNYCPKCGTTFADLEVLHQERVDPLYYMKYGPFTLATVRPETKFGDTAVAVHPDDKRYQKYIGQEIEVEGLLGKVKLKVIGDSFVDPNFGTGVVKVTPAHDKNDYEAGLRHNLEIKSVIGIDGRLNERAGKYAGLKVAEARKQVVADLQAKGLMVKIDENYTHSVAVCYKGGHDIEPMVLPNWFVKVATLKQPALEAVTRGDVKIFPKWREKTYTKWMEDMHDWPISRQVVWGIRIPVWYEYSGASNIHVTWIDKDKKQRQGNIRQFVDEGISLADIKSGLQQLYALAGESGPKFLIQEESPGDNWFQETDTFDTWFSSGHWPLVTLHYPDSDDFKNFYPTSVLETGWEIIRFWVSRMIMFGIYLTGKPPFEYVYLHGLVRAMDGRKMSKSFGNIINPDEYAEQYGVDALRMGLISGTANGKDFKFPKDKVLAYRNFGNKLWNMGRFILIMEEKEGLSGTASTKSTQATDKAMVKQLQATVKKVDTLLSKFRFAEAAETIYHFMWDEVAATYIESVKDREDKAVALPVLRHVYLTGLSLLHPFMPFVTEAIWQEVNPQGGALIVAPWPSLK